MSCPDWARFIHEPRDGEEEAAWELALAHLDHCERCWPAALRVDPTLVFRRLPEPEMDAEGVEQVRAGVEVLRRSRSFEGRQSSKARAGWGLAAALLLAASIAFSPEARTGVSANGAAVGPAVSAVAAAAPESPFSADAVDHQPNQHVAAASTDEAPLIDKMEERGVRIYQLRGKGMAVVMIVDRHIDV